MKCGAIIVAILTSLILPSCTHAQQVDFPVLTGPYLGQKPPGKTPALFAVDIPELQNLHGMIRFSSDGKEAYWKPVWRPVEPILVSKMENGQWTAPTNGGALTYPYSSLSE